MTRSDDLTGLLLPPDPTTPFRQGVVVEYNSLTGRNKILVGGNTVADGAVLEDLPILNIGDTVNLVPNDVVVLMKYLDSWAIMGRVITPGSGTLAANVVATQTLSAGNITGVTLSGADTIIAQTADFTVPAWANRCDFILVGSASVLNNIAAIEELYISVAIDWSDAVQQASGVQRIGIQATSGANTLDQMSLTQNFADFRTPAGAPPPTSPVASIAGLTFKASVRLRTNGSAITNAFARVSCIAIYTKV